MPDGNREGSRRHFIGAFAALSASAGAFPAIARAAPPAADDRRGSGSAVAGAPVSDVPAVTPEMFGARALEDGGDDFDNHAALMAAMAAGSPVDGAGKTYLISTPLRPKRLSGMRRVNIGWLPGRQGGPDPRIQQDFLLNIIDQSDWFVEDCGFDLGKRADTGSADDSSRGGLRTTTSDPNIAFNERVRIENCRFSGNGNGTRLFVRSCRHVAVIGNRVGASVVEHMPDPTNDCQNGIDLGQCQNFRFADNEVHDLRTRVAGRDQKLFSRGMLFFENADGTVIGNIVSGCDQNFDFSGGITTKPTDQGNRGLTISGNASSNCRSWAFKFANAIRDSVISGNVARNFGMGGFVFTGASGGMPPGREHLNTQNLLVAGNLAADPTGEGRDACRGFWIGQQARSPGYPRGIRLVGNMVSDSGGPGGLPSGKLEWGYVNEVPFSETGGTLNELRDCESDGHVKGVAAGFHKPECRLLHRSPQPAPNDQWTALNFTEVEDDSVQMQQNVDGVTQIIFRKDGTYILDVAIAIEAVDPGPVRLRLKSHDGQPVAEVARNGVTDNLNHLEMTRMIRMVAGAFLIPEAWQGSGKPAAITQGMFSAVRLAD